MDTATKHNTAIRWTHGSGYKGETWNPVIGCSKVSPGCAHCYAEQLSFSPKMRRFGYTGLPWTEENAEQNVTLKEERLLQPLHWAQPRMIFVNSMSDLFHRLVPDAFLHKVFAVMALSERHVFQVLTKRPERALEFLAAPGIEEEIAKAADLICYGPGMWMGRAWELRTNWRWPLPNVWLGASIENARFVHRMDTIRQAPAVVHFISFEPLLGDVGNLDLEHIEWTIVGGESGPNNRVMQPQWARNIRNQCLEAGVAFYYKQSGGRRSETGQELDGVRWEQMPSVAPEAARSKQGRQG